MKKYREILKESFLISWKNKYLWFFGLFAALFFNNEYSMIVNSILKTEESTSIFPSLFKLLDITAWARRFAEDPLTTAVTFFVIILLGLFIGFLLWVSIISKIGLVRNVQLLKSEEKHDIKTGVVCGTKKFLPVFVMSLVLSVLSYYFVSFTYFMASLFGNGFSGMMFAFTYILLLSLTIILSFMIKYAIGYIVIKNEKTMKAIALAFNLFKKNWLVSLEMAFLLFFINIFAMVIMFIVITTFSVPSFFMVSLAVEVMPSLSFALMTLISVLMFVLVMIMGAILSTFQIVTWTNLYIELVTGGGKSRLVKYFHKK